MKNSDVQKLVSRMAQEAARNVHVTLDELAAARVLTPAQVATFKAKYVAVVARAA
jgi:hypothetical protein